MSKPNAYIKLERKIAASEKGGVIERWRYGRALLEAKAGRKQLPHGLIGDLVKSAEKVGLRLSETEIRRRIRCAEVYDSEAKVSQALADFGSWSTLADAGFPEVTVDEIEEVLTAIENGPAPERLEFEQLGMFPEIVKSIPLAEATLRHLIAYAEEMAAMTASYARRDIERREHLNALSAAVSGDLDATYPEAVSALRARELAEVSA